MEISIGEDQKSLRGTISLFVIFVESHNKKIPLGSGIGVGEVEEKLDVMHNEDLVITGQLTKFTPKNYTTTIMSGYVRFPNRPLEFRRLEPKKKVSEYNN